MRHFENNEVVAVGGRLLVANVDGSLLERVQSCEYMKTFQIDRRIFAKLNAQCLISGAFGRHTSPAGGVLAFWGV